MVAIGQVAWGLIAVGQAAFGILFGLGQLDYIVSEYVAYYNQKRPHQRKDNKPLLGVWPDDNDPPTGNKEIVCHSRLGGMLKHYQRMAA